VPNGLAVAVGDRANSPKPELPTEVGPELDKIMDDTARGVPDRGVTLVRVDGRPTIGCVMTFSSNAKNPIAARHDRAQFVATVQARVAELAAVEKGADPLTALSRAAAAAGQGGTVVLVDSGLQTVAPLDFSAAKLLDADTDHLVAQLAKAGELPDLHGRRVVLAGIGYTAPPQASLSENQRAHLIELWQKIVTAAGGRPVVVTAPNTTPSDPGLPKVKKVVRQQAVVFTSSPWPVDHGPPRPPTTLLPKKLHVGAPGDHHLGARGRDQRHGIWLPGEG
jgi:OmpA-OmpF porin, OOP family